MRLRFQNGAPREHDWAPLEIPRRCGSARAFSEVESKGGSEARLFGSQTDICAVAVGAPQCGSDGFFAAPRRREGAGRGRDPAKAPRGRMSKKRGKNQFIGFTCQKFQFCELLDVGPHPNFLIIMLRVFYVKKKKKKGGSA